MNTESSGITSNVRRAVREVQRQRPLTLVEGIWKNVMNDLIWVLKDGYEFAGEEFDSEEKCRKK